jgi:hypothetical protein
LRPLLLALASLGLGLAAGCGSGDWATASGKVTLDDAPLKEGVITFHPAGDQASAYGQVTDGEFSINTGQKTGLKPGKYKVTVSATTVPESGSAQRARLLTPKKYAVKETSDLEADVKPGSNSFTFAMHSPK